MCLYKDFSLGISTTCAMTTGPRPNSIPLHPVVIRSERNGVERSGNGRVMAMIRGQKI